MRNELLNLFKTKTTTEIVTVQERRRNKKINTETGKVFQKINKQRTSQKIDANQIRDVEKIINTHRGGFSSTQSGATQALRDYTFLGQPLE